jgi:hypothetical protein
MENGTQLHFERRGQIEHIDQDNSEQDQIIVAQMPNEIGVTRSWATGRRSDDYRQALRVILETPQVDRRLNYVTAGMIVAILGVWLTGSVVTSRAFALFTDLVILLSGSALAALLVGMMLGEGVIPLNAVPVLLYVLLGMLVLFDGIMLVSLLLRSA